MVWVFFIRAHGLWQIPKRGGDNESVLQERDPVERHTPRCATSEGPLFWRAEPISFETTSDLGEVWYKCILSFSQQHFALLLGPSAENVKALLQTPIPPASKQNLKSSWFLGLLKSNRASPLFHYFGNGCTTAEFKCFSSRETQESGTTTTCPPFFSSEKAGADVTVSQGRPNTWTINTRPDTTSKSWFPQDQQLPSHWLTSSILEANIETSLLRSSPIVGNTGAGQCRCNSLSSAPGYNHPTSCYLALLQNSQFLPKIK